MSLDSIVTELAESHPANGPWHTSPRADFNDTRVQCGERFFHARAQAAGESDEDYAKYLGPHLAELVG